MQDWQHPYVNVFKKFSTQLGRRGECHEELDSIISKRVFKIQGAISANNYLQIPNSGGIRNNTNISKDGGTVLSRQGGGRKGSGGAGSGGSTAKSSSNKNSAAGTAGIAGSGLNSAAAGPPSLQDRGLGLTGQYVYLQMRTIGNKFFNLHLDFVVADRNMLERITLSNMHQETKAQSRVIIHPLHLPRDEWTTVNIFYLI